MAKFEPGTKVIVISGSPIMTVNDTDETGNVTCYWFDKGPHTHKFPENVLEIYSDDPMSFTVG